MRLLSSVNLEVLVEVADEPELFLTHAALEVFLQQVDRLVPLQGGRVREGHGAVLTFAGPLPRVRPDVVPQVVRHDERLRAELALVGLLASVEPDVHLEAAGVREGLRTEPALEGLLAGVRPEVLDERPRVGEGLEAQDAGVQLVARVLLEVVLERVVPSERHVADGARVGPPLRVALPLVHVAARTVREHQGAAVALERPAEVVEAAVEVDAEGLGTVEHHAAWDTLEPRAPRRRHSRTLSAFSLTCNSTNSSRTSRCVE